MYCKFTSAQVLTEGTNEQGLNVMPISKIKQLISCHFFFYSNRFKMKRLQPTVPLLIDKKIDPTRGCKFCGPSMGQSLRILPTASRSNCQKLCTQRTESTIINSE